MPLVRNLIKKKYRLPPAPGVTVFPSKKGAGLALIALRERSVGNQHNASQGAWHADHIVALPLD